MESIFKRAYGKVNNMRKYRILYEEVQNAEETEQDQRWIRRSSRRLCVKPARL